jgi:hypothetical protein
LGAARVRGPDCSVKQWTMLTVADANVTINEGDTRRLQFCEAAKKPIGRAISAPPEGRRRWYLCLRCEAREAPYRTGAKIQYFAQTLVPTAR